MLSIWTSWSLAKETKETCIKANLPDEMFMLRSNKLDYTLVIHKRNTEVGSKTLSSYIFIYIKGYLRRNRVGTDNHFVIMVIRVIPV